MKYVKGNNVDKEVEIGDCVKLNSGSPSLTVKSIGFETNPNLIEVVWLDSNFVQVANFDFRMLTFVG